MIMSVISGLKLVFFDLDDTLYEYHGEPVRDIEKAVFSSVIPFISLPEVLEAYHFIKQKEDEDYLNHKLPMREFYDSSCRFSRLLTSLHIDDKRLSDRMAEAYWTKLEESIRPFPDVEPVLKKLKRRYELGILTNGLTAQQKRMVSTIGLGEYFDYFFTSELVNADKPSKEYFDFVLNAIKHRSYECALVGDDPIKDVESANNAGMVSIWYNRKGLQQRVNAHYVINEFKEFLQIL